MKCNQEGCENEIDDKCREHIVKETTDNPQQSMADRMIYGDSNKKN